MKLLSVCIFSCIFALSVFGQNKSTQNTENQIIVKLKINIKLIHFLQNLAIEGIPLKHIKKLGIRQNIHLLELTASSKPKDYWLKTLAKHKNVIAVQANHSITYRDLEPDDFFYPEQWDMDKIGMPEVWELGTGGITANGDTIIIAILDSAFDIEHPDLKENVWHNHAEIPNDNIDNDGNGYIDDFDGWNFRHDSKTHALDDPHGHKVAGIIGAKGDNQIGTTGINWNVKLLLLDTKQQPSIIAAYEYIIDLRRRYNQSGGTEGAFIVASNASWGSSSSSTCDQFPIIQALFEEMGEVGILTVAATLNKHEDVDQIPDFPTTCTSDYLITITNSSDADEKVSNSGYGKVSIDMAAPGDFVYTTRFHDDYGAFGGASAATPHATGAIGLLYSLACPDIAADALAHPAETAKIFKKILLEGVDPIASLKNYTLTGGRLNVANSALLLSQECKVNIGDLAILNLYPSPVLVNETLTVEYQAPDFEEYTIIIHNTLGQMLFKDIVSPSLFSQKLYTIEMERFTAGLYTFTLQRNDRRVTKKFLVVR